MLCATPAAFADVQSDYRGAVAADAPFAHYAFSDLKGAAFSAPAGSPEPQPVSCHVWKDSGVKAPEVALYLSCVTSERKNSGTTWIPTIRELRVGSAPKGAGKPSIVGLNFQASGRVVEKPLDKGDPDGPGTAGVARIELTGNGDGLASQELELKPFLLLPYFSPDCPSGCSTAFAMSPVSVRPFAEGASADTCPAGANLNIPGVPQFTRDDCVASVETGFAQCAVASPLDPVSGSGPGRYCLTRSTGKPGIEPGPFSGSGAMEIGGSETFTLAVPSAAQWTGEFTAEYWARWRGRFGGALTTKFGDKAIVTGFACEGTGAITTFDVISKPVKAPPNCKGLESATYSLVASSVGLSHSAWHHIILVRTADEMQMWVDGARNNDGAVTAVPPVPDEIGIGIPPFFPPSDTLIAEPALYLKALSPERIAAHYEAGRKGSDTLCGIGNNDLFIGEDSADKLSGALGSDELDGGLGNDTLNGGPGNDKIDGGPGNDKTGEVPGNDCRGESLAGNDVIEAGPGNDRMQGGPGSDQIDGGPGKDLLDGGLGNDKIDSADGAKDTVKCGPGRDTVTADKVDTLVGCETVKR